MKTLINYAAGVLGLLAIYACSVILPSLILGQDIVERYLNLTLEYVTTLFARVGQHKNPLFPAPSATIAIVTDLFLVFYLSVVVILLGTLGWDIVRAHKLKLTTAQKWIVGSTLYSSMGIALFLIISMGQHAQSYPKAYSDFLPFVGATLGSNFATALAIRVFWKRPLPNLIKIWGLAFIY